MGTVSEKCLFVHISYIQTMAMEEGVMPRHGKYKDIGKVGA